MDESKELAYSAANLMFIGAVLAIALLFFGVLRTSYAKTVNEQRAAENRIEMENRYKEYNSNLVNGRDVLNAITAYSSDVSMQVTGAYNYVDASVIQNRIYSAKTRKSNPEWFKVSVAENPLLDNAGLQCMYRKESRYYAILTYDWDSPEQLAVDMGLDTIEGRNAGTENVSVETKIQWLVNKYNAVRAQSYGYEVSGILFVCLDVPGISASIYRQTCIY